MGRYLDRAAEALRQNPPFGRRFGRNPETPISCSISNGYTSTEEVSSHMSQMRTRTKEADASHASEILLRPSDKSDQTPPEQQNYEHGQSVKPNPGVRPNPRGNLGLVAPRQELGPGWWRDEFQERAGIREHLGGYTRLEAERLAWGELENRWHHLHGARVSPEICAGCRRPMGQAPVLDLADGNRVHDAPDHACLIRHGKRWRGRATDALVAMGLKPPAV